MTMANAVDEEAKRTEGKKALAVESFARALRQVSVGSLGFNCPRGQRSLVCVCSQQIPTILADNAGYDSSDLVAKLRAAHYEGRSDSGLGSSRLLSPIRFRIADRRQRTDMEKGIVGSMRECGVTESYKLKRQVVLSASEAAEMILRVDDSASLISFSPLRPPTDELISSSLSPSNSPAIGTKAS